MVSCQGVERNAWGDLVLRFPSRLLRYHCIVMFVCGGAAAQEEEIIAPCVGDLVSTSRRDSDPIVPCNIPFLSINGHSAAAAEDIVDFLCLDMVMFFRGAPRQ